MAEYGNFAFPREPEHNVHAVSIKSVLDEEREQYKNREKEWRDRLEHYIEALEEQRDKLILALDRAHDDSEMLRIAGKLFQVAETIRLVEDYFHEEETG